MSRLLSACFTRLSRHKVFWLGMVIMFVWSALMLIEGNQHEQRILDDFFFQYAPVVGGFCAVFISLFLGTDYSDGTIRNKIAVGHSRKAVYLSNMIVCLMAGIMMNAAWILAMLTIGVPLFGWPESGTIVVLGYLLITVFMIAAFVSIFTMISMLNQHKASAAVTALLTFLLILFVASYCYNRLHEPEMYSAGPVITRNGVELSPPRQNPDYVSGNMRRVYGFLVDFLPAGQAILMANMEAMHPLLMPLYSLIIVSSTTIVGVLIFQRRDLK